MIGRILKFVPRLGNRNVNGVARLISTSEGDKSLENPNNHEKINLVQQRKIRKNIRTLTTLNHSILLEDRPVISETESREFMAIFPDIVRDLTDKARDTHGKEIANWFSKVLEYNVPRDKMNRGLFTVLAYKKLVASKEPTEENLKLCRVLGWCSELLQTVLEMSDDIMNGTETRFDGQPCWYKFEDIGLNAVNDAIMVESAIFILLQKYFCDKDYYVRLLELFREITSITLAGQTKDLQVSSKTVDSFDMETYKEIVADKGSYYTFYLPVALAMIMADFNDPEAFRQAKTILLEIGHLYQVQEDFLNSFGDSNITGNSGSDIQKNKCSWLAVVAMQRANNAQKTLMRDCYGSNDPGKVDKVKQLYIELGIPNTYAIYEEELYNLIRTQIQQTSKGIPHDVFFTILNQIHRRNL